MDTLESFVPPIQTIEEKVKQRRSQMLIHSYLYYVLDKPLIDDDKWQSWANELIELQKICKKIGFYDREFSDWNGDTGMHLPKDVWVRSKAEWLLKNFPT